MADGLLRCRHDGLSAGRTEAPLQRGRRRAAATRSRAAGRQAALSGSALRGWRAAAGDGALPHPLRAGLGAGDDPDRPRLPHGRAGARPDREPADGWRAARPAGRHLHLPRGRRRAGRGRHRGDPRAVRDRRAVSRPPVHGGRAPGRVPASALRGALGGGRPPPDRGVARAGHLFPLGVAQPRSRARRGGAGHRARCRRAGVHHRRRHHRPRRRAPVHPPGTARRQGHADRPGGGPAAVRPGRHRRPRHRHLRPPAAGGGRGVVRGRRPRRLGRGAEPGLQPRLYRDRRHAVGHRRRHAGRQLPRHGALGRRAGPRQRRGRRRAGRAAGRRPQLGARDRARRGHRQAGALPGALPLAGRRSLPAARPPQPGQLQQRHLAHRRGWRRAHGPGHLRLHRRPLPGLAAARRRDRRRGARLRVRAAAHARPHRARPA